MTPVKIIALYLGFETANFGAPPVSIGLEASPELRCLWPAAVSASAEVSREAFNAVHK